MVKTQWLAGPGKNRLDPRGGIEGADAAPGEARVGHCSQSDWGGGALRTLPIAGVERDWGRHWCPGWRMCCPSHSGKGRLPAFMSSHHEHHNCAQLCTDRHLPDAIDLPSLPSGTCEAATLTFGAFSA
jgi:hypothetical protein